MKYISVAMLAGAALLYSSCVPYDYGTWSVSTNGYNTSVAWTNASYDVNGFPIYGYSYGRPVYGYTAAGAAIFTLAALTAACYVPHWGPAPWYRGSWHYPAHIHRAPAPPRFPAGHRPAQRPAGGMNAPIHKNPASVLGPARPHPKPAHVNPPKPSQPNPPKAHQGWFNHNRPGVNVPKPGNNQPDHGVRPGNQANPGNHAVHNPVFRPANQGNNAAHNPVFRPANQGNNGAQNHGVRPANPFSGASRPAMNQGARPAGNNGAAPASAPVRIQHQPAPSGAAHNHASRPAQAPGHSARPSAPMGGGAPAAAGHSAPGNGGSHSHRRH